MTQSNNKTDLLQETDLGTVVAQATTTDKWQVLSYSAPILPIHAALLRTGKVFFFCGSGNDPNRLNTPYDSVVWDVNKGTFTRQAPPLDSNNQPIDIFCAGHSFRPDGMLLVAGGTLRYDPFYGSPSALMFDPIAEKWVKIPSMNNGRWYPTVLTLGSGRILAVSGPDKDGKLNRQPEIYSVNFPNGWNAFPTTSALPAYLHLFLLSNGDIFYSGAQMGGTGVTPRILTLPGTFTQSITEKVVPGLQNPGFGGDQAASVLLPPAQDQKVMIIGGGGDTAINRVNIVDLKASNPTYVAAKPLNYARKHHSAVLLPDRTVFVCNGSKINEDTTQSMLPAEIYNPATNTWTVVAKQNVPRVYHSVALLLPDGRVVTAGGNPRRRVDELRLEIYSPAYMSRPRPIIQSVPQITLSYGLQFTIQTPQAANIKWVSLIRPMATTHSCDAEQRLVDVPINFRDATSLNVTITNNRNIAPPGWYMIFITDNNGTPSVATWRRVS
ncbi:DUF1929 domain-containing protein [Nostoc flagelliforme FACHB-838]|uniref:DUF1929 domain-containing protein n=1 Tax=Nostoc flagelliforme FACHB-838 TaxID=2692904 RepID=A0ABR8DVD8_9NOSO|nr:galactose oxidase-like domain-containing protein [Nostoc flagelliforme]MBD2532333.1 DUF1929 domain-containing protein [Nostoc flagelliforme FACHB-838]